MDTLKQAFDKVKCLNRVDLLRADNDLKEAEEVMALVTTYLPEFQELPKIVKRNWQLLERSSTTKKLSDCKLVVSYKRPQNLKDILVRAKLPPINDTDKSPNTNICKSKSGNCRYCINLNKTGRIKSTATGREYMSKHNISCRSSNLIYCITCKICKKQYVGQTKNTLMQRFQCHWTDIKCPHPKTDIGKHFNLPNHHGGMTWNYT